MTAATKSDRSGEGGGGGDVLPLAGLRVLNMAHVLAGPSCGWMLAMLGAEVVKVERPGSGDLLRIVDEDPARRSAGMGLGYQSVNAGKRSLAVDFKTAAGREIVLALADRADVLVQSFRAGALDALGLGPDDVVARNPRLVYCAISGFGQDGPRKGVRAFDHVIQAASGIMALTGEPDGGPQKVGTPVSDTSTGVMAAFAILAALHERQRTGRGRFLDVSMLHTMFALMAPQVVQTVLADAPPVRVGNSAFTGSPTADCFRCGDADILIGANTEAQFAKLMEALGWGIWLRTAVLPNRKPASETNPRFAAKLRACWQPSRQTIGSGSFRLPASRPRSCATSTKPCSIRSSPPTRQFPGWKRRRPAARRCPTYRSNSTVNARPRRRRRHRSAPIPAPFWRNWAIRRRPSTH